MKKSALIFFLLLLVNYLAYGQNIWGRLANPGFENQYIKSTYFFAGNWRNGVQFYEYNPTDNTGLYTLHPSDSRHLGWSENVLYRTFAINEMIGVGVNMINMSYWGPRGTDNWAYWAPMQTSTYAHDELFTAALDKHILIAPYIESYAATTNSDGFSFMEDFPGSSDNPAPQLISVISELLNRYLIHPGNARWPEKWARAFDQDGNERYIISIIHVSSDQGGVNNQTFAEGFDLVADSIYNNTGIRIGFMLDALPVATYSPGNFKITPENADTWLSTQKSILGIQCFIPEIWTGFDNDNALIEWKRDYCQRWNNTSIPFIIDVSPGYDAHVVFPSSMIYGNNQAWRDSLTAIVEDIPANGITVNTWNGYTEGFAAVPTLEYGTAAYNWIATLYEKYTIAEPPESIENSSEHNEPGVYLYPNPAGDNLTFHLSACTTELFSVKIYNLRGVIISSGFVRPGGTISMEGMESGMYIITICNDQGTYSSTHKVSRQ